MYLKVLGKQGLAKHKNQYKERNNKGRAEIKEMKMKGTIQRINKAESWVSGEGNTWTKFQPNQPPKERERHSISETIDEDRDITTDTN